MLNVRKMHLSRKVIGIVSALILLISALYVPLVISAAPAVSVTADETVTFAFDDAKTSGNQAAATADGIGYWGWATGTKDIGEGNRVFHSTDTSTNHWLTKGGYRLNKLVGEDYSVYQLEESSAYVVALDVRVLKGAESVEGYDNNHSAGVRLGWGATYSGSGSNYVNGMTSVLKYIIGSAQDSTTFTLTTEEGKKELPYGSTWHTVVYQFTTPADMGTGDKSLMLWAEQYPGFECQIDNVSVTKLGDNTGVIVFNDEYSGESQVAFGEIGTNATLPDVSENATAQDHTFLGWCSDEARTQQVSEISFTNKKQILYSKWTAPVSLTFRDTLNNADVAVVTGLAGTEFEYPADPVDPNGEQWFMGWYTTEACTEEFTSSTLGFSNATVYSLWKSEIPGLTQDFENYDKDTYTVTTTNGVKKRSNAAYFGPALTKQSETTYGESNYAVKIDWDSTMVKSDDDENSYNASGRYNQSNDNVIWLGNGIEDGQSYIAKFKVNVEKADADVRFLMISAAEANGWQDFTRSSTVTVSKDKAGAGWIEVEIPFTTSFATKWGTYMYLSYMPKSNADFTVYVDDVVIEAVAQPYEALVTIEPGTGENAINIKGVRGEEIVLPSLTHPDGAEFLGFYTDSAFTNEFTGGVFTRNTFKLYAKWGKAPMTFREYPYADSGKSFGNTMSIVNEAGVGINDDYALRFLFDGDSVYKTNDDGSVVYMNTRAPQQDHVATIGTVTYGKLYTLSFYYRTGDNCQTGYKMQVVYGADNIWQSEARLVLDDTVRNEDGKPTDWKKVEIFFISKQPRPTYGNNLFIQFFSTDSSLNSYVEAYVDNIMLEEVKGDVIYFHGNTDTATDAYVVGTAGDTFTVPNEFKNGRAELLGLYLDAECTKPFTSATIPAGLTEVYASWSNAPITFEDYPYSSAAGLNFGRTLSIANANGIGIDDDYALRFTFDADSVYKVNDDGTATTMSSRFDKKDHVATVGKIEDGAIYRVTYNYKVLAANNINVNITLVSGDKDNIWQDKVYNAYSTSKVVTSDKATDWITSTHYISAKVPDVGWTKGDTLYILFTVPNGALTNYADVLVDNVLIERIDPPYIFFDAQNESSSEFRQGKAGEAIDFPANPSKFGYTFNGWYLDAECTKPFTDKTYVEGKGITVYGGWKAVDSVEYDFESYDLLPSELSGKGHLGDAVRITTNKAHSGNHVIQFDRTVKYNVGGSYAAVAYSNQVFEFDKSKQYVVTVHYYIEKRSDNRAGIQVFSANKDNYWDGFTDVGGGAYQIAETEELGVWKNASFVVNSEAIKDNKNFLYIRFGGGEGGIYYIDDVTVTAIPEGKSAVLINKEGDDSLPNVLIGKKGESFANKLPAKASRTGKYFRGYYTIDSSKNYVLLENDDMKFKDTSYIVYARFIDFEVTQNFDDGYKEISEKYIGLTIFDYDYEVYDATAQGNSKDNVTSGKYSLHRKGTTPYFENAVLLTSHKQIANDQRYTVTFKVKMGNYLQTDGAIKIASNRSPEYSWTPTGSYYPVMAIADLTDGAWHEVTYTFNSVERYLILQTPGYVELFIDDVKVSLVTDKENNPVSTPVEFTEYVPAFRDQSGNLIAPDKSSVDVSTIIDDSLYNNTEEGINILFIIIPAAAVLLAAIAAVLIIVLKKRKTKV